MHRNGQEAHRRTTMLGSALFCRRRLPCWHKCERIGQALTEATHVDCVGACGLWCMMCKFVHTTIESSNMQGGGGQGGGGGGLTLSDRAHATYLRYWSCRKSAGRLLLQSAMPSMTRARTSGATSLNLLADTAWKMLLTDAFRLVT